MGEYIGEQTTEDTVALRDDIGGVLFRSNRSGNDFSVEMLSKDIEEAEIKQFAENDDVIRFKLQHAHSLRFNRKRFVQELLVEVFLDVMNEDDRHTVVVELRSTRTTHHLQNVCKENAPA